MSQASLPIDALLRATIPTAWQPDEPPDLAGVDRVGFDTETTGLRWRDGDLPVGVSVAWRRRGSALVESRYLPYGHRGGGNLCEETVKRWEREQLRGKQLVGLNVPFDAHMERAAGVDLEAIGCTLTDVGHRAALLDDHRGERWNYKEHGGGPFQLESIAQDVLKEGKVAGLAASEIWKYHAAQVTPYARQDASLALRIFEKQEPLIVAEGLERVAALEDAVIWPAMEMERNGAPLDVEKLRRWDRESEADLTAMLMKLYAAVGFRVNPDSPSDMERLFALRGIVPEVFTPGSADGRVKSRPSFTAEVLAGVAKRDPLFNLVTQAARLSDLRSKYIRAYLDAVGADGVLRFSLHQLRGDQYGTVSGRFSTSAVSRDEGASVQQVMAVEKQVRLHGDKYVVREAFVPGSGLMFKADAKQIEYRLFAHYADSPRLNRAYADDPETDFHEIVGVMVRVYRPDFDRKRIKNFNFATLFGAGIEKKADMLGVTEEEAEELSRVYDRAIPEARALMNTVMRKARRRGWVKTLTGRRTRFPQLKRLHKALNGIIQGSAADIMKMKLVELYRERKSLGFTMRMTIHDEVVGDVPDAESARRCAALLDSQSVPLNVPILWDAKTGANWRECD